MLIFAFLLTTAQPNVASAVTSRTELLSGLLGRQDLNGLTKTLNKPSSSVDLLEDLDWERDQMLGGAVAFVSFRYAADLWQVANLKNRDGLRETAAIAMLYAVGTETIDGSRCKDITAAGHRVEQFAPALRPIVAYMHALPLDTRRKLADLAIKLDARTMNSASRRADWFLCSGGLDEIQYGLSHGSQRSVPTPPGYLGQTVVVDAKGYKPAFLPEVAAAQRAGAERAHLMSTIAKIAGL